MLGCSISGAGCTPPLGIINGGMTRFDLLEPLPGCAAAALLMPADLPDIKSTDRSI
jgi:hypothetical protein